MRPARQCHSWHYNGCLLTYYYADQLRLLNEVTKLMKLLVVLPSISCSVDRSFSSLRRLKTYLTPTMTAAERLKAQFPLPELTARVNGPSWRVTGFHYPSTRLLETGLNSITLLHIHKELSAAVDINDIMEDFISTNDTRRAMFGAVYVTWPVCLALAMSYLLTDCDWQSRPRTTVHWGSAPRHPGRRKGEKGKGEWGRGEEKGDGGWRGKVRREEKG